MSNLGTRLRHLIELLDGGVNATYDEVAPGYRARFTPIVRALDALGSASVRDIARHAGMTHSAVSQTIAQMKRDGMVVQVTSDDGRERAIAPSARLKAMRAAIDLQWQATAQAASGLDGELSMPLRSIVEEAITALERDTFSQRIDRARKKLSTKDTSGEAE
jgi:DNA-binding MarR family transcriptional regulator